MRNEAQQVPSLLAENIGLQSIEFRQQNNQNSDTEHNTDATTNVPSTSENMRREQEHIEATQTLPNIVQLARDQSSIETDETASNAKSLSVEHLNTISMDSNRHCTQSVQNEQNTTPTDEL